MAFPSRRETSANFSRGPRLVEQGDWHRGEGSTIKADTTAQRRLLDLQHLDSAIAQLGYRRRNLPEHAELAAVATERDRVDSDLVGADTALSDLEQDQARAESELEPVRERLARNEKRIADGTVPDPKALASMIDEVAHLKRRIGDLEDAELEVMEAVEEATATRDRLRTEVEGLSARATEISARRDEIVATIDAEGRQRRDERGVVAAEIPADLMGLYTKIAASHGGVGAAELVQRRCTGCQLEVNAADLRVIIAAPSEEVVRCEECSRILIRTENSGL